MRKMRVKIDENEKGRVFRINNTNTRAVELYRYNDSLFDNRLFVVGRVFYNDANHVHPVGPIAVKSIIDIEFECMGCDGTGIDNLCGGEFCPDCDGNGYGKW